MPITMSLKEVKSKYTNAPPSWSVSVSGATVLFKPDLEKFLYFHGIEPFAAGEGRTTWTLPPAIGDPPLYLAVLLKEKFNVQPQSKMMEMIVTAIKDRPAEDGLERFLGRPSNRSAGRERLKVEVSKKSFVCVANCDVDDRARQMLLSGAGWLPIPDVPESLHSRLGSMPFRTSDPFMASNLRPFMSSAGKVRLNEELRSASKRVVQSREAKAPADFAVPVPAGLDYLDFQKAGIQQVLDSGKSALIADDMGLGKTIQGIGVLNGMRDKDPERKSILVLCQANMKVKWCKEIEKWSYLDDLTIGHAKGSTFPETDVVAINYDIAQKNIDAIRARKWDLVIFDEAHNMGNEEALRTKALLGDMDMPGNHNAVPLSKGGIYLDLTGTPRPNRISQLWPLLTSLRPDVWGSGPDARRAFLNRYEPPFFIEKEFNYGGRFVKRLIPLKGKPRREQELQFRLRSSGMIRRLKSELNAMVTADGKPMLPPKFRTPLPMDVRLTKAQQAELATIEADIDDLVRTAGGSGAVNTGETKQATHLIDAVAGMPLHSPNFQEAARLRRNLGILKAPFAAKFIVEELKEDKELDPEDRAKTVVFAHHKDVIDILYAKMDAAFPGQILRYDGTVSDEKKRQPIIDAFQEDPKKRAIIISLSGATGITLTAAARMRVVEMDWLPSNMVQIEDRIWRIGQEQSVDIGYLFIPGSHDLKIGNGLITKMESEEASINTLSMAQLDKKNEKARQRGQSSSRAESVLEDADTMFLNGSLELTPDPDTDQMSLFPS
jgi:SWI/SNF-related matrix-associated actin-dependent regulator 1 of chromatin subfamily A